MFISWPVTPDSLSAGGSGNLLALQWFQHDLNMSSEQTDTDAPVSTRNSASFPAMVPFSLGLFFFFLLSGILISPIVILAMHIWIIAIKVFCLGCLLARNLS